MRRPLTTNASGGTSDAGAKIFVGGFLVRRATTLSRWAARACRLVAEPPAVWMEQGKPMMNRFGQLGLTTVSNGLNFVAQTIGILSQTHGQMYAYVMATVRIPISRLQMNSR